MEDALLFQRADESRAGAGHCDLGDARLSDLLSSLASTTRAATWRSRCPADRSFTGEFHLLPADMFDSSATPVLLYAPVPFLLWAALRLGPLGTSTSLLTVAIFVIWGAIHGHGPFVAALPEESALSIQLFLSVLSITLLLLSAVIEQNGQTAKALRDSEERFRLAISAAKMGTWDWWIQLNTASWSEESTQMFGMASRRNPPTFDHFRNLLHPDDRDAVTRGMCRAMVDKLPFEAEFRVVRPDETVRWVLGKGGPVRRDWQA